MNAHSSEITPAPMESLALAIMSGDLSGLPCTDNPYFELADWQSAASEALDGDHSELAWMLAREEAFERFCEWQGGDFETREFADFPNWLLGKASWAPSSLYYRALTVDERRTVDSWRRAVA